MQQSALSERLTAVERWSDWFDPMVIKELRQSLRTREFVATLLTAQAAMLILSLFAIQTAATPGQDSFFATISNMMWFVLGVPLLLALPFAGWRAVRHELRMRKFELVMVSGQTERSLVAGKWWAKMVESGLLVVSVFPYFLLRYFLGEIEVVDELALFCGLFLGGASLAAYAIAVGPYSVFELLGLLIGAAFILPGWLFVCGMLAVVCSPFAPFSVAFVTVSAILFVVPTVHVALDIGALGFRRGWVEPV